MSESVRPEVAELEEQLDAISLTLSGLGTLDRTQAERVGGRVDHLTAQLRELTPPPREPPARSR